jgi:MFS family permease
VIVALVTVPFAAMVIDRPGDQGLHPDGGDHDPAAQHVEEAPVRTGALLSDPTFWLSVLIFSVVMAGMIGMISNLAPMANDVGYSPALAALLPSCYGGGGVAAKLGFAAFADRVNLKHLMLTSLGGFAIGMACLVRPETGFALVATGAALVGFFGGFMVPLQGFFVARVFGTHVVGRVMGLLSLFILAVMLVTPPLFGKVFDVTGSYAPIFAIFVVIAAITMLMVPYIRLQPKPAAPDYGPIAAPLHGAEVVIPG